MTQITTFDRFFLFRSSCKPFTDIECLVTSNGPIKVFDNGAGAGAYSIQLNVTTKERYWLQNTLQFFSIPLVVWTAAVFDPSGKEIHFASDTIDVPFSPQGAYRVDFGISRDGSRTYRTVAVMDGSKVVFMPNEKELFIDLDRDLIDASLDIVGFGNASEASFSQADFDIECFMHSSVEGDVVSDITCDGRNTLTQTNLPLPMVCGRYPAFTGENSNLLYDVQSAATSSAFLKAHPA
jgi:hypothetical protein